MPICQVSGFQKDRKRLDSLVTALEKEMSGQGYGRDVLCSAWLLRLLVEIGRHRQQGDAFAARNKYALDIDFEVEPQLFEVSHTQ